MSDDAVKIEGANPQEQAGFKRPEVVKPQVGEADKKVGETVARGLGRGENPDNLVRELASLEEFKRARVGFMTKARRDLEDYYQSHESGSGIDITMQTVSDELIFLDKLDNLEEARERLGSGDFADTLNFLGQEARVRNNIDNMTEGDVNDANSFSDYPSILEDQLNLANQAQRLFMLTCDRLFPTLRAEVNSRDFAGNLDQVTQLLEETNIYGFEVAGIIVRSDLDPKHNLANDAYRQFFNETIVRIGDSMYGLNHEEEEYAPELQALKAVDDKSRQDVIAAAKAMYILNLSNKFHRPGMSPAEFFVSKHRMERERAKVVGSRSQIQEQEASVRNDKNSTTESEHAVAGKPPILESVTPENLEAYHKQNKALLLDNQEWQFLDTTKDGRVMIQRRKTINELLDQIKDAKPGDRLMAGFSDVVTVSISPDHLATGKWIVEQGIRPPSDPQRKKEVDEVNSLSERLAKGEFNQDRFGELRVLTIAAHRQATRLEKERDDFEKLAK